MDPSGGASAREGLCPSREAHAVHFYDRDEGLVGVVASYLGAGLRAGEGAIAIATAEHLAGLDAALDRMGLAPAALREEGTLVALDADVVLGTFMEGGRPDPDRFRALLAPAVDRARGASFGGRVRAFGEMVEVLRRRGSGDALLAVEDLWSGLVDGRTLSLLCAYPLRGSARREDGAAFELLEAERLARAEIALLYRLTDAVGRAGSLDEVYAAALDGIEAALGARRAAILLFDPDAVVRFKAWRGLSDRYRAAVEGHSPWRAGDRHPAPLLVEDARRDVGLAPLLPELEAEGVRALGFFPLSPGGRLLGKFMVYHPAPHAFGEPEVRLAMAIADHVAFAVDRALASLERERFLGVVGHDLRNPLNAIAGSARLLLRGVSPDAVARSARRIVSSAERMERLIAQVLDFARARHVGGLPVRRAPCDLAEIAGQALEELQAVFPGRTFALSVEGDARGDLDADRLGEVFSNLGANAAAHGGDGPVTVRLRGEGPDLVAEVHNGGPVIPAEVLPELFEPYRRGPGAERSAGVGLGLYISREIARAHGGTLDVRSSDLAGTTFVLRVPRGATAPGPAQVRGTTVTR